MTPMRIQRKRTKGWRLPPHTVCVTRPGPYANYFKVGQHGTAAECVAKFREEWNEALRKSAMPPFWPPMPFGGRLAYLGPLKRMNLACWCHLCPAHADGKPLGVSCTECVPCHADILLELANAKAED